MGTMINEYNPNENTDVEYYQIQHRYNKEKDWNASNVRTILFGSFGQSLDLPKVKKINYTKVVEDYERNPTCFDYAKKLCEILAELRNQHSYRVIKIHTVIDVKEVFSIDFASGETTALATVKNSRDNDINYEGKVTGILKCLATFNNPKTAVNILAMFDEEMAKTALLICKSGEEEDFNDLIPIIEDLLENLN